MDSTQHKSVKIAPKKLAGRWQEGYALDYHTVSSLYLGENEYGHAEYCTKRSEVGELLYQLKYHRNLTAVEPLANTAARFVRSWRPGAEIFIPVPASRARAKQPVLLLGKAIAERLNMPFESSWVNKTKKIPELKNVYDYDERLKLLEGAHKTTTSKVKGRTILLFDDLYRSGATMNKLAELLYDEGKAAEVFALTITRTRSNR